MSWKSIARAGKGFLTGALIGTCLSPMLMVLEASTGINPVVTIIQAANAAPDMDHPCDHAVAKHRHLLPRGWVMKCENTIADPKNRGGEWSVSGITDHGVRTITINRGTDERSLHYVVVHEIAHAASPPTTSTHWNQVEALLPSHDQRLRTADDSYYYAGYEVFADGVGRCSTGTRFAYYGDLDCSVIRSIHPESYDRLTVGYREANPSPIKEVPVPWAGEPDASN